MIFQWDRAGMVLETGNKYSIYNDGDFYYLEVNLCVNEWAGNSNRTIVIHPYFERSVKHKWNAKCYVQTLTLISLRCITSLVSTLDSTIALLKTSMEWPRALLKSSLINRRFDFRDLTHSDITVAFTVGSPGTLSFDPWFRAKKLDKNTKIVGNFSSTFSSSSKSSRMVRSSPRSRQNVCWWALRLISKAL